MMVGLKLDTGVKGKKSLPAVDDFFGSAPEVLPAEMERHKRQEEVSRTRDAEALKNAGQRGRRDREENSGKKMKGQKRGREDGEEEGEIKSKAKQAAVLASAPGIEFGSEKKKKKKPVQKNDKGSTAQAGSEEGQKGVAAGVDSDAEAGDSEESEIGEDDEEKNQRTIFVGSIPHKMTRKQVKALFKECGDVESVSLVYCTAYPTEQQRI